MFNVSTMPVFVKIVKNNNAESAAYGKHYGRYPDHPFDYEHIFAQAYALWQQGYQYWFSKAEIEQLAVHNRQFETPRLEAELVQMYFRVPSAQEPGEFMPVALALQLVGANITQKLSVVWLGRAFMELGFQKKTIQNVCGYLVVRRSADEMRALRNIMAQSDDGDCIYCITVLRIKNKE